MKFLVGKLKYIQENLTLVKEIPGRKLKYD